MLETVSTNQEEQALVSAALAGRRECFDTLVARYLERTFHVALRMVGNREDAEDLAQETFVRAHTRLAQFSGRSRFGTWVTAICVRLCLDHERARKRRPRSVDLYDPVVGLDPAVEERRRPQDALHRAETAQRVETLVAALPHRLRAALVLRVIQGMDYEDVASALGTTVRSARIYVSEARRRLADQLELRGGRS